MLPGEAVRGGLAGDCAGVTCGDFRASLAFSGCGCRHPAAPRFRNPPSRETLSPQTAAPCGLTEYVITEGNETQRRQSARRSPWPWLTAAAALIGSGLIAALFGLRETPGVPPESAPQLAEFAPVEMLSSTLALDADGFVRASERVRIVSEVEGRIVTVSDRLRAGARVEAGDLLVEIDSSLYAVSLDDALAAERRAAAELDRARDQEARIAELERAEFDTEARLEALRTERAAAEAALAQARAAVGRARLRLEDTRIEAPFDAQVVSESAALGRYLRPGEVLAELAATAAAEIEVGLAPAAARLVLDATRNRPGNGLELRATVGLDDGPEGDGLPGVVDRILPQIDPAARTLDLVVRVDSAFGPVAALRLGELVHVNIEIPADDAWRRLPATALKLPDSVFRLGKDNRLEKVPVTPLLRQPDTIVVRAPELAADDRVLLTDLTGPMPGQQVRLMEAQSDRGSGKP